MRVAYPWVMAAIFGALLFGIPMTFVTQRPKVWAIGPHFAEHLMLWLVGGAAWGGYMRYIGLRRSRNKA